MKQPNPRSNLRLILMLAGILPLMLVLAFALKVGLTLNDNSSGRDAFDQSDYTEAAAKFKDTRSLNWFETWIAAFDTGTGLHADENYDAALKAYHSALKSVPAKEECTVRINLALVHEALGDGLLEDGAAKDAIKEFESGIKDLADGDCPTDAGRGEDQSADAAAVDERLRNKIKENQPEKKQKKPPPKKGKDPKKEKDDPRPEQLEESNQRGAEQRKED
ncbi:MAG: hypothetical protein L0H31_06220, partial [Nocardioidaceae bacterium]|nr:hypothetical protein [Nocardioidaceae bacterium]